MPPTPAHIPSPVSFPLQGPTPHVPRAAHAHILPGKGPWGTSAWCSIAGQRASHVSAASLLQPVFVQLFPPPSPNCGRGQEEQHRGEGRPLPALIKHFTPPVGPGSSAKPPHPVGGSPKLALFAGCWGLQRPRSHQRPGPRACPLPEPCSQQLGAPPRASRHQIGLRQPSCARCPVPGPSSSGRGCGPPTHWPPASWGPR